MKMRRARWALVSLFVFGLAGFAVIAYLMDSPPIGYEITEVHVLATAGFVLVTGLGALITKRLVCPKCAEYAGRQRVGDIVSSRPTHARVDGGADRRFKDNPYIHTYEIKCTCTKCSHRWSFTRER